MPDHVGDRGAAHLDLGASRSPTYQAEEGGQAAAPAPGDLACITAREQRQITPQAWCLPGLWRLRISPGHSVASCLTRPGHRRIVCPASGRDGLQADDRGGDLAGPAPACGEAEPQAAAAADQAPRDGEQAQPQAPGLPPAGLPARASSWVQASSSQARATISHRSWLWANPFRWQVPQPGVLGAADPVLAADPAAVPQFQVRELAFPGVGGERGEPVPVEVGDRSCAPGCGRSLRTMTRIPAGQEDRSSRPVMSATQAPSLTCSSAS